jgi:hypothetical protein
MPWISPVWRPDMLTVRTQAIDGTGTYTPLDSQPCRLLPFHALLSNLWKKLVIPMYEWLEWLVFACFWVALRQKRYRAPREPGSFSVFYEIHPIGVELRRYYFRAPPVS